MSPSTRAPGMRSFMRLNARSTVVLPLPDEPMKAVTSCSWMLKDTSVTALKALYQIETFLTSKTTSPGGANSCGRDADAGRATWVTTVCSGSSMIFLARESAESGRDKACHDHEDEGYGDERERSAPAAGLCSGVGRAGIREDQDRQRDVGAAEHVHVYCAQSAENREQERCRLPGGTGDRQQRAADDSP